jgi:hypothetical protein
VYATLTSDRVTKVKKSELPLDQRQPAVRLEPLIYDTFIGADHK